MPTFVETLENRKYAMEGLTMMGLLVRGWPFFYCMSSHYIDGLKGGSIISSVLLVLFIWSGTLNFLDLIIKVYVHKVEL